MPYRVDITRKQLHVLDGLPAHDRDRLAGAIAELADGPRPARAKKLRARTQWRIRVREYRVVYSMFDKDQLVTVDLIARRTTHTYD